MSCGATFVTAAAVACKPWVWVLSTSTANAVKRPESQRPTQAQQVTYVADIVLYFSQLGV